MDVLRNESRISSLFNRTREGLGQGETMRFVLDMITVKKNGMYLQMMTMTPTREHLKMLNGV